MLRMSAAIDLVQRDNFTASSSRHQNLSTLFSNFAKLSACFQVQPTSHCLHLKLVIVWMTKFDDRMIAILGTLHRRPELFRDHPNSFISLIFGHAQHFFQGTLHEQLQNFLTQHSRALIELPRDHGKTTQICGRILWELGRAPNLRIKIICATDIVAKERLIFLKDCIEMNPRLRFIFPKLKPGKPWSADSFSIARPAKNIGPSVAAFGLGSGSTGTRADLLICDDIVDTRSLRSRAERERVKLTFENNTLNLLEPTGRFWGLYTPWHEDDLNAHLKKNGCFSLFRRAIDEQFTPIWPEKWSREQLIQRQGEIGDAAFSRGYRLIPVSSGEVLIDAKWLQYWLEPMPKFERIAIAIDPAVSESLSADQTAIVVLGLSDKRVYCLEAIGQRISAALLQRTIYETDCRWKADVILFETNGAFRGVFQLMQEDPHFGARMVGESAIRSKVDRIRTFATRVFRGQFLLKQGDAGQAMLINEMRNYPYTQHDDLIDAAAAGTELLLRPTEPRVW